MAIFSYVPFSAYWNRMLTFAQNEKFLALVKGIAMQIAWLQSTVERTRNPSGNKLVASMTSLMSRCSRHVRSSRCSGTSQKDSIAEPSGR